MPDSDLLALLDHVEHGAVQPQGDVELASILDAVEGGQFDAPEAQYRPVAAGVGQAFQNAGNTLAQTILSAPALVEAVARRFVGPEPSASDPTPLGGYLALQQKQAEADAAAASYDRRPGLAGIGQEALEGVAGSVPAMAAPAAAGVSTKVAPLASAGAQALQRLWTGAGITGLQTTVQGVQEDPTPRGVASAVTQGILEAAFMRLGGATGVEAIFRQQGEQGVRQGFRQALADAAREAGRELPEEALTSMSQTGADDAIRRQQFDPEAITRAGAVGGLAGAAMGGGMQGGRVAEAGVDAAARAVAPAVLAARLRLAQPEVAPQAEPAPIQPAPPGSPNTAESIAGLFAPQLAAEQPAPAAIAPEVPRAEAAPPPPAAVAPGPVPGAAPQAPGAAAPAPVAPQPPPAAPEPPDLVARHRQLAAEVQRWAERADLERQNGNKPALRAALKNKTATEKLLRSLEGRMSPEQAAAVQPPAAAEPPPTPKPAAAPAPTGQPAAAPSVPVPVPPPAPPVPAADPAGDQPGTGFRVGQRVRWIKGKKQGVEATVTALTNGRPVLRTDDGKTIGGAGGITPENLEAVQNAPPAPNAGAAPVEAPRSGPAAPESAPAQPANPPAAQVIPAQGNFKSASPEAPDVRQPATPAPATPTATAQPPMDAGRERVPRAADAPARPVDGGAAGAAPRQAEPAPAPVPPASQPDRAASVVPDSPVNTGENAPTTGEKAPAVVSPANAKKAAGLRAMAAKARSDGDSILNRDRLTNTPKRQREAQSARIDGNTLVRAAELMDAYAKALESGNIPKNINPEHTGLKMTKEVFLKAARKRLDSSGYYDIHETDKWSDDGHVSAALRELAISPEQRQRDEQRAKAQALKAKEEAIRFTKIPGFFPTPPALADETVRKADIQPGMRVLEPEGGKGDLAQRIEAAGGKVDVAETQASLREILEAKGFNLVGRDMMEMQPPADGPVYDRIVMNPPFENGQDREHVRHAYDLLKPGGRLVAIMSPGPFQRSFKADQQFKAWAESVGAVVEDNEAGSFAGKEAFRQTGVHTVTVTIDKPKTAAKPDPAPDTGGDTAPSPAAKPGQSFAPERPLDGVESGQQPAPERPARGRIPVAPIAPTAAGDADRVATSIAGAMTKLRDEFRARGVGDPQLAAGETPKGAGGMFDEATGVATLYRSNDLDTAAHELGHQVAWKFGIDTEDVPGETDFFAKTGSQAPPNLTGKDLRDYRAKEAWAEFVRAWIVNPEATEAQAPRMTEAYKRAVPEAVRSALADFGRFGREFLGLPPAARTQANIEQTEALIEAGSTVRAVASMFNLGEAMTAARAERSAWAKMATFLAKVWKGARVPLAPPGMRNGAMSTDEIKAYREAIKADNGGRWAAFRWQWQNVWFPAYERFAKAYEIRGREVKPENDFRILNRLLAGTDGKVLEAVFGSGLRDSRNRPAVDEATGESLTLPWLLDPISKSVDRDTGEVAATTPGAFTKLINKAMAYGVELRTFGRGSKLLEQADKDAQRFVDDLDAFINGTADMGVLDSIEQRWKDAGLDQAQGTKLRVIAARLTKMVGEKARAPDARGLRKFTEEYGRKVRDMAAEKAARLSGIGAGLTSDYRQAEQALKGRESDPDKPAMDEFLRRYRRWAQHLIQYLQETGVYSEDQAKKMLESDTWTNPETGEQLDFYLDMHRLIERDGTSIMPGRRFTGSTKTVRNPLANLLEATLNAIASGDRNRAMLALADAFRNRTASGEIADDVRDSRLGEWGRQVPEDAVQQARASGQNTVNGRIPYVIKNNGVKEFWTFDPWVEASIEAARRQGGDGNLLLRLWATATRIMRTGITTFPSFMLRNLARDLQARAVASESAKGMGLMDVWRGFGKIESAGREETADSLRKVSGASYAGYNDGRVQVGQALAQHLDSLIRPTAGGKVARVISPQTLMRATERLNEWFEAVNRNAELVSAYREAKAKGLDDFNAQLYAADKARGLIDFAEAGVYSRQLNRAVLFVNPAIQGLARFFRTWKLVGDRAAKGEAIPDKLLRLVTARATIAMGLMTAAALAVRALKSDDEEEKWRQQDPTVRDFHWHIPISGGPDLAVPRPYDWGFMLAGAERLADAAMAKRQGNEAQVKRAMEGYAKSAMGAMLPINDVSSVLGGFAPIVEAGFNYDSFRQRHIIPTWDEGVDLRLRDTDRASALGKILQDVTQQDARLIDHIIEGYAGNWGRAATSVGKPADWWLGTATGMFKADPAGAARDVQWVYDEASRLRMGSSAAVRSMTKMLKEARNAPTVAERERLAERARKYAAGVRNQWEKNPPKVIPEK